MSEQEPAGSWRQLGSRHPGWVAAIRVAVGVWLLVLMGIFYGSGHGSYWAWLYAAGAALLFYLAYTGLRSARRKDVPPGEPR